MKVLLNQHLSWKLKTKLAPIFDDVKHVKDLGFTEVDDSTIIAWAKENGYAIITKDSDYNDYVIRNGHPPLIIWLKVGNCSTDLIVKLLNKNISKIIIESKNGDSGVIIIV